MASLVRQIATHLSGARNDMSPKGFPILYRNLGLKPWTQPAQIIFANSKTGSLQIENGKNLILFLVLIV